MASDALITQAGIGQLIRALEDRGHEVVGPTVRDGAIVYDRLAGAGDLPTGWTDRHAPGSYRLERRDDQALFGYVVGPHSWKAQLDPPRQRLFRARREVDGSVQVVSGAEPAPKLALLGVRSCELAAIAIQDRVFLGGEFQNDTYAARRKEAFVVVVNCAEARGTCFCVSMDTGPKARNGFDLALTELLDQERHDFLVEVGSERGAEVLKALEQRPASAADRAAAKAATERATSQMGRKLDTTGIKELLQSNQEHPRFDAVADRCLSCANCTLACPTCFCSTVEDVTDLDGSHAERWQRWDSCFTLDFSYIHGGSVRRSAKARYRQWLTHKLAHWIDQFGSSGCVGCGRCITWCPVGIDITEEVAAIRADVEARAPDRAKEGDR